MIREMPTPKLNVSNICSTKFTCAFVGFPFLNFILEFLQRICFFSSVGIIAHTFGPKRAKVSVPYLTVCTLRVSKIFFEQYCTDSLTGNTRDIISGDILFTTLYSPIARVWVFLSRRKKKRIIFTNNFFQTEKLSS